MSDSKWWKAYSARNESIVVPTQAFAEFCSAVQSQRQEGNRYDRERPFHRQEGRLLGLLA